MTRKRVNKTFCVLFFFLGSALLLSSCADNSLCDPTSTPSLKFSFHGHKRFARTATNGFIDSAVSLLVYSVRVLNVKDSIKAYVVTTDSIADTVRRSGLTLPVSSIDTFTTYQINMYNKTGGLGSQLISDTLYVSYTKKLVFLNQGCGYGYNYTISPGTVRITTHFFNSIKSPLSNPLISTDVPENFQVIYNNN